MPPENCPPSSEPRPPQKDLQLGLMPRERQELTMARLWQKMSEIYGHRFQSAWGECATPNGGLTETCETWLSGLAQFTLGEIKHGLNEVIKRGDEWPPSLPELMALCRVNRVPKAYRIYQSLPQPEVNPSIVKEHLSKMKAMVKRWEAR